MNSPLNFVHIPKTGGSSIAAVIGDDMNLHRRASETPAPRFTCVRNPEDRAVSAYCFMRNSSTVFRQVADCSLEEFVTREHMMLHPQVWWCDDVVDVTLRFESLSESFKLISDKPLPHLNRSVRDCTVSQLARERIRSRYAADYRRWFSVT